MRKVPPRRLELRPAASEADALSIELRGRVGNFSIRSLIQKYRITIQHGVTLVVCRNGCLDLIRANYFQWLMLQSTRH